MPGIPRSSESPWGSFVGTWDTQRAPLRANTIKTNALSSGIQDIAEAPADKQQTPSPKHEDLLNVARSQTSQQEAVRVPSPKERANPQPQSQGDTSRKTPSPSQPAFPTKSPIQEIAA